MSLTIGAQLYAGRMSQADYLSFCVGVSLISAVVALTPMIFKMRTGLVQNLGFNTCGASPEDSNNTIG